jgi:CheY-like chemotaxis protein
VLDRLRPDIYECSVGDGSNTLEEEVCSSSSRSPDGVTNSSIRQLRVLVVDADAPTRMAMSTLIRKTGAVVVTARHGEEAMTLLLEQRFDVLLTDLKMPVMDGFELVQQCQRLPETHRPGRIIAIGGEYQAGALRGQTVLFLPKPLKIDALLAVLSGLPN